MAQSVLGKINYLTEEQYNKAKAEGRINPDEIYMTPDDVDLSDRDTSPIGTIHSYAGLTEPKHWLFCDGRELSRLDYKKLFDVIGITYGEGDGNTTFNLPDLRGRIPVGVDSAQEEFTEVGKSGGKKEHNHNLSSGYAMLKFNKGSATGGYVAKTASSYKTDVKVYQSKAATADTDNMTEGVQLGGTTDNSDVLQPYLVLNYIIKY